MHAACGVYAQQSSSVENVIGASLSEPHTNRYYEKTAIVMCVCMCPRYVVHMFFTYARYPFPHLKLHVRFLNNAHQPG